MLYLTYDEYTLIGGDLTENEFKPINKKAEMLINSTTLGRVKKYTDIPLEIKDCIFELIKTGLDNHIVASTSNDGVNESITEIISYTDIINLYLSDLVSVDGVPLLYRGIP